MPPAARIGDNHTCPIHGGGAILPACCPSVIVGGMPVARVTDLSACGPPDAIVQGEDSVIIGGRPAARMGDPTQHGGTVVQGCRSVLIGKPRQAQCLLEGAATGAPFLARF
ncbi:MAG: PAAR domain-containing protein [Polyangiales bacterium]